VPSSRLKLEFATVLPKHRYADNVCGQKIAGKLNTLETQAEHPCETLREHGFAKPRKVFNQQMPTSKQARQRQGDLLVLAENDTAQRFTGTLDGSVLCILAAVQCLQSISLLHLLVLEVF
jgi:hypothetical protein